MENGNLNQTQNNKSTKVNGSTLAKIDHDQKILDEKKATDHKEFSKEEVKAIKEAAKGGNGKDKPKMTKTAVKKAKDEAKGTVRAEDEKMTCAVCNLPIMKGQAYKEIPADSKNPRRQYHVSTCSPGSPNWMKWRGDKAIIKAKPQKTKKPPKEKKAKPAKTAKSARPQIEPTGKHLHINDKFPVKKYERYPFERMEIGDYFIETMKGQDSVRRLSNRFAHKKSWLFSVRKVDDGFRCLRIK